MQHFKAPVILIHPSSLSKQQTLLELAWKLDDLSRLSTDGQRILVEVVAMKELHTDETTTAAAAASNIAKRLSLLYQSLQEFVRGICCY